jgi:hypothetical protein
MIIDARLRPATQQYLSSTVLLDAGCEVYHKRFSVGVAPSVTKRSVELCIKEMDEMKIDLGLAPARWGIGHDPIVAPEEVARCMKEYKNRFYGAIAVCAAEMDKSMKMIDNWVIHGPINAVCLEPGISPVPMHFDDARIYPLYAFLQEKEIPLFIMAGGLCGPDISYGNPEHLDKMLCDFPKLKVINIHGGAPFVDGVIFCALRRPNLFLCPDMYLDNTPFATRYIEAANGLLQDQFLFGTSYPFIPMKEAFNIWNNFPIKPEILPKLMYQNAARALNINAEDYKRF